MAGPKLSALHPTNLLKYSSYLKGTSSLLDKANDIFITEDNMIYITGSASGIGFPLSPNPVAPYQGYMDAYVTVLGTVRQIITSTYYGTILAQEEGTAVRPNSLGQIAFVGFISDISNPISNFPVFGTGYQQIYEPMMPGGVQNAKDAIIVIISADGQSKVFSTAFGGPTGGNGLDDFALDLRIESNDDLIVSGNSNTNLPDPTSVNANYFYQDLKGGDLSNFFAEFTASNGYWIFRSNRPLFSALN